MTWGVPAPAALAEPAPAASVAVLFVGGGNSESEDNDVCDCGPRDDSDPVTDGFSIIGGTSIVETAASDELVRASPMPMLLSSGISSIDEPCREGKGT